MIISKNKHNDLLGKIKEQSDIIKRLQIKICNGKHEFIETKIIESYSCYDIDFYHYYQCKNCEYEKVERR